MAWVLYVLFALLSLVDIVLVFAGGVGWFGDGTLGLFLSSVITLLGPALVYSSTSGSARGTRLGTTAFGPAFAIGISITTFFAASAIWRAVTDAQTTTASRVMAGVVAVVVCAMLAGAPAALKLQVQRLGLGKD
ncbi:MAG TPA: hypothetical protein VF039_14380 [Longimicrobiales bacterium]